MPRFFIDPGDRAPAAEAIDSAQGGSLWLELPGAAPVDLLVGEAVTSTIPADVTIMLARDPRVSDSLVALRVTEERFARGGQIRVDRKRRGLTTISLEEAPVIHLVWEASGLASIDADFSGAIILANSDALPEFPAMRTVRSFAVCQGAKIRQWSVLERMGALERLTIKGLLSPLADLRSSLAALGIDWLKLELQARRLVTVPYDDIVAGAEARTFAVARALAPIVDPAAERALATPAVRGDELRSSKDEPDKYAAASIDVSTSERTYEERQGPHELRFIESELVQRSRTEGWHRRSTKSEVTVLGLSAAAELKTSEHAMGMWGSDSRAAESRARTLAIAGEPSRVLAAVDRFVAHDSATD